MENSKKTKETKASPEAKQPRKRRKKSEIKYSEMSVNDLRTTLDEARKTVKEIEAVIKDVLGDVEIKPTPNPVANNFGDFVFGRTHNREPMSASFDTPNQTPAFLDSGINGDAQMEIKPSAIATQTISHKEDTFSAPAAVPLMTDYYANPTEGQDPLGRGIEEEFNLTPQPTQVVDSQADSGHLPGTDTLVDTAVTTEKYYIGNQETFI